MNATYEQRLAELTTRRAERKDIDDLPRSMTPREVAAYMAETSALDRRIHAIRAAVEATVFPTLDDDAQWLAHLIEWHGQLTGTLDALPPRILTDEQLDERRALNWSIALIERGMGIAPFSMPIVDLSSTRIGALMAAAGYEI